jgi:glutamate dehydrogenase
VVEIVSDDMPFIVDSVTMELAREGYTIDLVIHPVIRVRRDEKCELLDVLATGASAEDTVAESVLPRRTAARARP